MSRRISPIVDRYGSRVLREREWRVLALIAEGCKNQEIADICGTTKDVAKNWLRAIYDKLGMSNRVELAMWYVKQRSGI
jgi:DNA-binding NarL/FixJ family response regulator